MSEPKMKCANCKYFMFRTYQCVKSTPWKTDTHLSCKEFEPKLKTNRDLINEMTDEELAAWKHSYPAEMKDKNGYCRIYWQNPHRCRPEFYCRQCLTEWLKAPAGKHQEVGK